VKCPFCSNVESKVIDSRASAAGDVIRRRRECEQCAKRFTSYERVEDVFPPVVKKDGAREPYDRQKLVLGLRKACYKRPVAVEKIEQVVDAIEGELATSDKKEISARDLGEKVMTHLRTLDEVAYVRFASVYRSFRDIDEFRTELDKIALSRARAGDEEPS
jgi:transcriptional repressor NrdR